MSRDWTGIVIVRLSEYSKKIYLFETPAFSGLKKGDTIICDTSHGEKVAKVVASDSVEIDKVADHLWLDLCGASLPLKKVKGRFEAYNYPDAEGEDNAQL